MSSNKLKVQGFRANDLADDTGKQFELGKSWCDFFELDSSVGEISFILTFKPISKEFFSFENKQIELKLSEPTGRNDRKAYANGDHGLSAIKDFFIYDLKLTENNVNDYFAIYKASEFDYYLYYIPQLLHDNFIKLFETVVPVVSTHRKASNKKDVVANDLQRIYYGAPGTGKSFEINRLTKEKEVIRTTFHPDSDYSTFVGAYKPTSIEVPVRDVTGKVIVENGKQVTENRIVYEFVEQAFLQAYIKAWSAYANKADGEKAEEQYLVIEEINRGNCAQIFGDLFQLLDRNGYGFSDYPITADKDMKKQLARAFDKKTIADAERINSIYDKDIVSQVLSGDILLLPDNLYIWATMNTSDQSLFPIDSAFKRRWDWKYMPICEGRENGLSLDWKIKVKGHLYDWWQFVEKINAEINEQTKSEDKKLGYFFCKAQDGIVSAETFVSKVIFYLWNDVFKDQAFASDIFRDGEDELTFNKFYDVNNNGKAIIKEDKVELFLQNLGISMSTDIAINEEVVGDIEEEMANDNGGNQRKETLISVSIPNHPTIRSADSTQFNTFVNALKIIGIDKIITVAPSLKYKRLGCPVISTQKYEGIENNNKGYSYYQEEGLYIIKGCKYYTYIRILEDLNNSLNIGLTLETK
jgi:hypothetical protein